MPLISVIVPVYNIEKYLHRCIDSILAQTFTDWELLLIDDGSKDSSGSICDEYAAKDERIRVFHKKNGGISSARNFGLDHVQGGWVMFVDSDDWIEPDMLEGLIRKGEETGADIVLGDFLFAYPDREVPYQQPDWDDSKTSSLNRYITSAWTCVWGGIHKHSLYEEHQLQSPQGVSYLEDFHLIVRLCYFAHKVANVHRPFYHYCQQGGSLLHNRKKNTDADERWVCLDIIRFFKEHGVYKYYRKSMCWCMLRVTQELVLERESWDRFLKMLPEKRHYIWDCPWLNFKLKVNMWCLTHHLSWISSLMLDVRKLCHLQG